MPKDIYSNSVGIGFGWGLSWRLSFDSYGSSGHLRMVRELFKISEHNRPVASECWWHW